LITCNISAVLPVPDDGGFGLGVGHFALQFELLVFPNVDPGAGPVADDLYRRRRNWKKVGKYQLPVSANGGSMDPAADVIKVLR
jgi:hypothetical protein